MTRARDLADSADKDIAGTVTLDDITLSNDITLADNGKAIFGAGSDLQIYHDGTNSYIVNTTNDLIIGEDTRVRIKTPSLLVNNAADTENLLTATENGAVTLYYDNAAKLATTSTGIDVTGTAVTDGVTVAGNLSVDGGTIKLDGNYPVGTANVALGDTALDDGSLSGSSNTALGAGALSANTTGSNTAVGRNALFNNTTGSTNTAVGQQALTTNTTGSSNTALGRDALLSNTTASNNTAVGYQAGYSITGSQYNTAIGKSALSSHTTGTGGNVGVGYEAGKQITTGYNNTAVGTNAGLNTTTAAYNVSMGYEALYDNTTGQFNTALGTLSLANNTTASENTAVGYKAMEDNTTASFNVAVGREALANNTTGGYNTALGHLSGHLTTGTRNTYVGQEAGYYVTTGSRNTILGRYNGNQGGLDIRTSSNNIVLSDGDGNPRYHLNSSGSTNIYSTSTGIMSLISSYAAGTSQALLTGVYSATDITGTGGTVSLRVWTNGNIQNTNNSYTALSDQKLKENIVDANPQWDDIKSLRVRNYNMIEGQTHRQIGLIAQEVETVSAGLVYETPDYDTDGNDLGTVTKSVNYSVLYMKAVKALQEAMDRIETLEAKVTALENA